MKKLEKNDCPLQEEGSHLNKGSKTQIIRICKLKKVGPLDNNWLIFLFGKK